jgi:hypothetical protein
VELAAFQVVVVAAADLHGHQLALPGVVAVAVMGVSG